MVAVTAFTQTPPEGGSDVVSVEPFMSKGKFVLIAITSGIVPVSFGLAETKGDANLRGGNKVSSRRSLPACRPH